MLCRVLCRVLWNRSLDAHAKKIDHGLLRMFMRFRIKVHRKLRDSAKKNQSSSAEI